MLNVVIFYCAYRKNGPKILYLITKPCYPMNYAEPKRLFDILDFQLKNYPKSDCLTVKKGGEWVPMSTSDFKNKVNMMSRALIKMGIQPGDNIALITTTNRPEWNIMDMAIMQIGAVNVPVYPTITSNDYKYIFNEAEVKLVFVSDITLVQKVLAVKNEIPTLKEIYSFDEVQGTKNYHELFASADESLQEKVDTYKANVKENDLATIIYTSGTTGVPKGVMLSHKNILSNVVACTDRLPSDPTMRALTILPICHVYERMLHYLYMITGISIYYAESIDTVGDNLRETHPHIFVAVPRLLEKVFDKIMLKGSQLTGIKKSLFYWSVRLAENYSEVKNSGWYNFKLKIARKLVFSKWMEALGGNVVAVASGSAALQPRLARIFLAAGVNVWEGYGLTETSPVVAVNSAKSGGIRIGTVGQPIKDVQVKFAEDGEICVKGPNVMLGYYKKPELTKEVIDAEGWFHTGDIGCWVEGKFLKITDRKKEMFKTSGGKYVAPQVLENAFKESQFIEQIMVIGDGQKFPAALVVPAFAFVREWCKRKGLKYETNEEIANAPEVKERIKVSIDKINQSFGQWEQVKKFEILTQEFSVATGELTPTLKFKRKVICEKYKPLIDGIYS